ncbi:MULTISPECIES: dihydrolipoyl dehydrogenase [unclassified Sphingomonas]|uniref:dihydrolipoyl dehydrogenase n=1 Tax=unclassified Sphingomonas TaxID=196159 RepID=UPI000E760211|nr:MULTISPECIES: dihydrolipoyl dehydrogenase [unclassified Sphingomonas]RKE50506.1 dihydrolipoamide dehydrogenase [Sphingomonas sp. PP-CC-1A-547]TCM08801.1 dihydrolipoamide dehydrogenase [Sphingomonas sp. PP-CC-3G-468]
MTKLTCDVAIIGAGTAGLAAERSARRNGAKTLLIDEGFGGTTCASVGCMPSKLLIAAGNAMHAVEHASVFGVEASGKVDGVAVMARVRKERDAFVAGVETSIDKLPEEVKIEARAKFAGATILSLSDGSEVHAKSVVIATGSSPASPEMFDGVRDRVLTNESIFDLKDLPNSLGVIGAGALGLELAQAMARLGVDTMVFDTGETIGGLKDRHVAEAYHAILSREMPILLGVELTVEPDGDGVKLAWSGSASGEQRFDYLLVATGRPPRIKGIGLETTGLALNDHGMPDYDCETMQCGTAPIFIAGDADHDRAVLHEASAEGMIAGRNAASYPEVTPGKRTVPFAITFTHPNVAVIGKIAKDDDADTVIGTASYDDQGRAKVEACNAGLVRFYADRRDGRLTGATMAGPAVEHSAHLIAWAIQSGWTATEVLDLPIYHPTFEEGMKGALRSICSEVHAPTPPDRDDGFTPGT